MPIFRFGDVFFKSFFTSYNVSNTKMGFAVSSFASAGTTIVAKGSTYLALGFGLASAAIALF